MKQVQQIQNYHIMTGTDYKYMNRVIQVSRCKMVVSFFGNCVIKINVNFCDLYERI